MNKGKEFLEQFEKVRAALDLVGRRGQSPSQVAIRLLVGLSGRDDVQLILNDRQIGKIANKLKWRGKAVLDATHSVLVDALDMLEENAVIPASSKPPTL